MPSDVFIQFVERKLDENGVAKVIPSTELLAEAFTTFERGRLAYEAPRTMGHGLSARLGPRSILPVSVVAGSSLAMRSDPVHSR